MRTTTYSMQGSCEPADVRRVHRGACTEPPEFSAAGGVDDLGRMLPMADTPEEDGPGTDVGCDGEAVDIGLKLAGLPGEIL
eukprot:scaffold17240_cov65-Phaeocystis_antarctica.AAC.2